MGTSKGQKDQRMQYRVFETRGPNPYTVDMTLALAGEFLQD